MSKFDSPSERTGLAQPSTFSSESCLGEYTQMRDRLKMLLSPKNSDDLYELLILLKNADLFGRETVSKIDLLFTEIANCTPDDDLTHVELADCFVSTLLSYIDEEYFLELLQNIILHTKNDSLIMSCQNRLFELVFELGMGVVVDKLRNPLGLVYVLLKSSNFFNLKFMSSKVSQDETRVNLGYVLCTQILSSMLASSSLYIFNFSSNFEQNDVYGYIVGLKLDNRNLKEFLNKEYFAKICQQIVYYCGPFENNVKFLENLLKICKFIHSKDISGSKSYRNLTVSILTQRYVNPLFQADLILTFLENMYTELISTDLKDYKTFSLNFKANFGFRHINPFNSSYNEETKEEAEEYKHEDDLGSDYGEDKLLKSDLFFNLFPQVQEEDLVEVYWVLETDILYALFQSLISPEHEARFSPLFMSLYEGAKNGTIFSRALIFKLSLIWSDYQNFGRGDYNPISLKLVTMNEDFWFLYEHGVSTLVPRNLLLSEMRSYADDFKDKRCEHLYDFMLNIAIHTDSDCFFIVLLEVLRYSGYDFHVLKYSLQMFQSTLLEFFKHNRVKLSRGVLEIVFFCRQYFDWGFMTMLIYSIDTMITGDSDKYAKVALSDGLIDYLNWKLQMEADMTKRSLAENTDSDTIVVMDKNDMEDQNEEIEEYSAQEEPEETPVMFNLSANIVAEVFYILHHLLGPTEVVLELFFLYNQRMKGLSSYNILLLPLYKGIEHKLKQAEKSTSLEAHLEHGVGDSLHMDHEGAFEDKERRGVVDFSDRTHFSLGPNKDIYGYLLLNEDSELTTSHVVTLIFSGKMAKNVLNAIKLLNGEQGSRPQYILDLILRKFVNKLQQIFLVRVPDEFCLHLTTGANCSPEDELLLRNLKLLALFVAGLVSLHINSVHIDSIYMVFRTLLECLKSDSVVLIEFAMMAFNNIKNLFNYPLFTKEFVSDAKVAKFYPNLLKTYKAILASPDYISEIETSLDQGIANEVISQDTLAEDKCLKGKITTKGLVIIKSGEEPGLDAALPTTAMQSSTTLQSATTIKSPPSGDYDLLVGLCNNMDYNPPKMHPLFYHEQCLMTILNVGVDDFFNTLKLQIEVPENSAETISAFATFSGSQFMATVESLVLAGNLDWLFFLILRHAITKGEASFEEITSLLQTLGAKALEFFVKFLSFSVNMLLKYLRSCRALLIYKKILLVCAALLGELTISRNKPLLTKHLNVKMLLSFSYEKGMLSVTVPFVCRLMSYVAKSKIFKLPNPWTFCVLSLLNEIKSVKNLKQVLVLEINNLILTLTSPSNQQQQMSPSHTSQQSAQMHSPVAMANGAPMSPTIDALTSVMKSNIVGSNINTGVHVKELLRHRVLGEFDQSCRFSGNIWSNSNETKLKIPPIHNDIKILLRRKIIINTKLLTSGATVNGNGSNGGSTQGVGPTSSSVVNSVMNMDMYNLILNAIESCYRESIFIIEKIVPICVSTCGIISKIDFTQETSIDTLKRCLTSMTTGLSTSLVNVICKEVLMSILSSEIYLALLNHYSTMVASMGAGGSGMSNGSVSMGASSTSENYPIFDCIWLEYISQILARDNLALVCALVEQLTLELMGRSLDEMISNWSNGVASLANANNISTILYNQFLSTLHSGSQSSTSTYFSANSLRNTDELSQLYKKYLSLVPSTIARVERTEKRPGLRFPDFFIVPPIDNIPTNLVISKFDEFEQRLKECAKYLLMYPPIVPMPHCKFLYKCESSSLLLLSFLHKNHQIFTLLWSVHYVIVKAINVAECYELILSRVIKNIVDSKSVSIPSVVSEVELSLLEMLCVDNANLLNITTSLLPNLTFNKLVLFLRFRLIKVSALDVYLCNSGDLEFVVKMVYRLIVESNYISLKELPLSLKFLSRFDKNSVVHSIGEPTKLSVVLTKLLQYSNSTSAAMNSSSSLSTPGGSSAAQADRLVSLRLLFVSRLYIRNRCVLQSDVSKKHVNMYIDFLNCETDSEVDLFFINFNENPIDQFITSALLITLFASYQTGAQPGLGGKGGLMGDREREVRRFDGIPSVTYGNPNFEYVPVFCKLVNGFVQTDVFILQKVLHILLSVLYKNYCLPVFFKIIQSFIYNPNYTFPAHVSISQCLLYCNPTEMTNFAPFWVQLATSKQLVQSLIQSPTEWPILSQLVRYVLIYYSSASSNSTQTPQALTGSKDAKDGALDSLLDSILNILLYLLQICPEFICGYYLSLCEVTTSVRFRNIFTFSTPKNVKCSNPSTTTEVPETAPLSFVNHIQFIIQKPTLKALTDAYIAEPTDRLVGLILKELQPEGILIYYTLYLGYTLPLLISKVGGGSSATQQPMASQLSGNASMKVINCYLLLEKLVIHSKSKLLVSSMLLHMRYPNLVTMRFVSIFKNLFERADNVQELIITCIMERLLVKPHPWGVVHLVFQLVKFKKFWTFVQHNKPVEEHLKKIMQLYVT
ncbi:conserved hypothetical protein [Theileria orientalis strain Shintoku]|uniref:Uncharacterized protein n=1 Tax=Theileria orientalis strain Shintoku TaxID=869250 RepID=J4C862_THEOR|nr:conserved hypothetical protein [Theileria orientalis strain Shintoku]BAM40233.1 conserved hypothetical protein [Theileria orientalis strain Shintoku]|eukprot:XP_009690534.1 conserved hypothetical protein [Theileria orientalis strain Shintoku]